MRFAEGLTINEIKKRIKRLVNIGNQKAKQEKILLEEELKIRECSKS